MLILNLIPATCVKLFGTGETKEWESSGMLKKHPFEILSTGKRYLVTGDRELYHDWA